MLKKFGINSTRAEKSGPSVKRGIAVPSPTVHSKIVTCECGAKLKKSCANEMICEISALTCPKCGREVR